MERMQRLLALLMLWIVSFPLMAPAALANDASNLPACCRRAGKHHCLPQKGQTRSGPSLHSRCACFPLSHSGAVNIQTALPRPNAAQIGSLLNLAGTRAQTEVLGRISFARSRQKRGPPSLLS